MARSYRILKNWDHWLTRQFLGASVLHAEQKMLAELLKKHFGKHAVLIGVPEQQTLLNATPIPIHTVISPVMHHDHELQSIESDFHELPILSGSVDLVLLPHTLEFIDNPQQLLAEACRIIKPEGLIVIASFNPYSIWGLQKIMIRKNKEALWMANFLQIHKIKKWLKLADFELELKKTLFFRPFIQREKLFQQLQVLETVGSKCYPFFGGINIFVARAKVIPLTPIRMQWKQQLRNIKLSTTISGHIAR